MSITSRLNDLGVTLPDAPAPAANYVPFVKTGNTVYVSGQISNGPDGFITGKLGADMDVAAGAEAAKTCAISLLAQVKAACDGDIERLKRVPRRMDGSARPLTRILYMTRAHFEREFG